MTMRHDPNERWHWEEEQRERSHRDAVEHEGRLARDTGDPRWGTGGMAADERTLHAPVHHEPHGRRGPLPQREATHRAGEEGEETGGEAAADVERGPYAGVAPRGYRRSDERVREDICERFTAHGYLDPSDVEVAVHGGDAMLTGTVGTRAQKRLAGELAASVSGVRHVHDHLRVEPRDDRGPRGAFSVGTFPRPEGTAEHHR
jgi:hypothetical protein